MSRIADLVEKTKRHIENYKKQDIFADATQAREGIETAFSAISCCTCSWMQLKPVRALKPDGSHFYFKGFKMQLKPVRALKLYVS